MGFDEWSLLNSSREFSYRWAIFSAASFRSRSRRRNSMFRTRLHNPNTENSIGQGPQILPTRGSTDERAQMLSSRWWSALASAGSRHLHLHLRALGPILRAWGMVEAGGQRGLLSFDR
eukprot:COSAG04_NODE_10374_length_782_cov_1.573939_1_plen_117_part_10